MDVGTIPVAIISNEMTPYRAHLLGRLRDEVPECRILNVVTHSVTNNSMAWEITLSDGLNIIFDEANRLKRPGMFMNRRSLALFRGIRDRLARESVRMIVLWGYNDACRLLLLRWARKEGIPILLTNDSNVFGEARVGTLKRMVKATFLRWITRRVSGLMPMGTCGRAFFRVYGDHDLPEFPFPNEPDYARLRERDHHAEREFRAAKGLIEGRRRFLYCGRFVESKRIDLLLDAFENAAGSMPDWDLVLVGDGPLRKNIESCVVPELRERVSFLGFLQMDELRRCYHSCDALVLPSEYEAWALVVNEAVACGLAIIATNVTGAAIELVRDGTNGLLVSPRSIPALADAMLALAQPGTCERMRSASVRLLGEWQAAADPVRGFRAAVQHFCAGNALRSSMRPRANFAE